MIGQYEARSMPGTLYFEAGNPGLELPFIDDADPEVYGKKESASGWVFDGEWGAASGVAEATYRTTLDNDNSNVTAMSDSNDWWFQFTYLHDGTALEASVLTLRHAWDGSRESKLVRFEIDPDPNRTVLYAGNDTDLDEVDPLDGWYIVARDIDRPPSGGSPARYGIHYKAATRSMDAFLGGGLIAADFVTVHDNYDLDNLEIVWSGAGVDRFRDMNITPSITPPPVCGDDAHPYPTTDLSEDCIVNLNDFARLVAHWAECTDLSCD